MPLASMSKQTSICGWPRGMGGMPSRLNFPRMLLSRVMERSPSKNLDEHSRLVICVGGEGLSLLSRDSGVSLDECGHHTPCSLQAKREGRDVKKEELRKLLGLVSARKDGG